MDSILKAEQHATRLRHYLQIAQLPELKILCGLRFFGIFAQKRSVALESYVREFVPAIAAAIRSSNPSEFLPEEVESLTALIKLLEAQASGVVYPDDLTAFKELTDSMEAGWSEDITFVPLKKGVACVNCLFVEYYPDLDLPPRGRLLNLHVSASAISSQAGTDDIVVRNPVSEPDDRFLDQARDSVKAARAYLHDRYGLSLRKCYRFDFSVDSTGARFTGDSLGVAFAIGAIAAVAESEVFRERITVSLDVALSGALTSDGELIPIDKEALKLKIHRAFHSRIGLLVIPREHLTESWQYVSELEKQCSNNRLELVGADTIESVASDPRLLPVKRDSSPTYYARKARKAKRSVWVEVPATLVLLAILFYLVAPATWMPWFDDNPVYADVGPSMNSLEVRNKDGQLIWSQQFKYAVVDTHAALIYDLDGDSLNEVIFAPRFESQCPERGWIYCYSSNGTELFRRYCAIPGKYPNDTTGVIYDPGRPQIVLVKGKPTIITCVHENGPARTHIKFWDADGDSLGWYINSGGCTFAHATDIDDDSVEELVFTGFNNRATPRSAALFVLDIDSLFGVSPPYECEYEELGDVERGKQIGYILFPPSDLSDIATEQPQGYNAPSDLPIEIRNKGSIDFSVRESSNDTPATILYQLDNDLKVVNAKPNDFFLTRRESFVASGDLDSLSWTQYKHTLLNSIRYWDGSRFVTQGESR